MAYLFVDGDYWLSGFAPASDDDVRAAIDALHAALAAQLQSPSPPSSPPSFEQRVVFFSSALLHALPDAQRTTLVSTLRRARFQAHVLDSVRGRVGSPIDAAMCTRIVVTCAAAARGHGGGGAAAAASPALTLCVVTANAYVATALDVATSAAPASAMLFGGGAGGGVAATRSCEVLFAAYDGDDVAAELLCYASDRHGIARLPRRGDGVVCVPHAAVAAAALQALRRDAASQLPLSLLDELGKLQARLAAQTATTTNSGDTVVLLPRGGRDDASASGNTNKNKDNAVAATTAAAATHGGDVARDIRVLSVVAADASSQVPPSSVQKSNDGDNDADKRDAAALPAGWAASVDAASGRTFYFHRESGRTTWTRPVEQATAATATTNAATTANVNANVAAALPAGWAQAVDPTSGKPYYYHAATGQTSWTRPGEPTAGATVATTTTAPHNAWEQRVDPATGRTLYVNHATRQTSWTPPPTHM